MALLLVHQAMTCKFSGILCRDGPRKFGRLRLWRGQWVVRCPLWWSRNAIFVLLLHLLHHRQHLSLFVAEGDPLRLPPCRSSSLHPSGAMEPVVSGVLSPSRPPPRGAAKPRARGPRMSDPEMVRTALQEMVTAPLLPPGETRVVSPFSFSQRYPNCINQRVVSIIFRSEEGSESSGRSKTSPLSSTSSIASRHQNKVREGHQSLSCTSGPTVEPGKCCRAH